MKKQGRLSETGFTKRVCEQIKDVGGFVVVLAGGNPYQQAGLPDRFIAHVDIPGGVFLEFKVGRNPLSRLQRHMLETLNSRGANAFVCRLHNEIQVIEDFNGKPLFVFTNGRELVSGIGIIV